MKPVVFIPGLPGSELYDSETNEHLFLNLGGLVSKTARAHILQRLEGPADPDLDDHVEAREPIDQVLNLPFLDFGKQAGSLFDVLRKFGYLGFRPPYGPMFRAVGWDWRLPVDQAKAQTRLIQAIEGLHAAAGAPVVVLAHSTGGLLLPPLLEARPDLAAKIDCVLSVAVPWAGTLKSLKVLAGQQPFATLTRKEAQKALCHSWAAFDLLPPDPAKTPDAPPLFFNDKVRSGPLVFRAWMNLSTDRPAMESRADRSDARFGRRFRNLDPLQVTSLAGWGNETDIAAFYKPSGELKFKVGQEGDGTVPFVSASWLEGVNVRNFSVPLGFYPGKNLSQEHSSLWSTPAAASVIGEVLGTAAPSPYVYATLDGGDAANQRPSLRVRLVALDRVGLPLANVRVRVFALSGPELNLLPTMQGGRGEIAIPRASTSVVQGGILRRFELEIAWTGGTLEPMTFVFRS